MRVLLKSNVCTHVQDVGSIAATVGEQVSVLFVWCIHPAVLRRKPAPSRHLLAKVTQQRSADYLRRTHQNRCALQWSLLFFFENEKALKCFLNIAREPIKCTIGTGLNVDGNRCLYCMIILIDCTSVALHRALNCWRKKAFNCVRQ